MSLRHAVTRPRRAGAALRRSVRALVALVALAALVVGVPLVLLQFGHWPITGVPTWEQVQELPSTLATDGAVLAVVTVALWAAWAAFVASVVVEAAAQVRGRRRGLSLPSGSLGGPLRGAARYLIGSLLMSVGPMAATAGVTGLAPAGAQTAPEPAIVAPLWSPPAVGSDVQVSLGGEAPSHGEMGAPQAAAPTAVTVARGDSPWSLAQDHLGDGARWREIWEVNRSRAQPDGSVWLDPEQSIQPGWRLQLPTGAREPEVVATPEVAPASPAATPIQALTGQPVAPGEVTVQPGDNFWELAEDQLAASWGREPTDAEVVGHWQALIDQNRDVLAPPGDPDLIHPGQVFAVPTPPADPTALQGLIPGGPSGPATPSQQPADCETPPAADAPAAPTPPPATAEPDASTPGSPTTTEMSDDTSGSTAPDDDAASSAPLPAPEQDRGTGGDPDDSHPDPEPTEPTSPDIGDEGTTSADDQVPTAATRDADDGRDSVPVGLIGGGVAVAGALILLERRRRAQQRRRRRGRVVAPPPPDLRTGEQQLRWGADIAGARLLDVALRAAAAGAGATGLPTLRWAEAAPDVATLVLVEPSPAPPGFVTVAADRWMTSLSAHQMAPTAAHAASPAPTLVPVGTTDVGSELLVDLESSGVVTVYGAAESVLGLLRSVVVATATSVWSDQPRIVTVGLDAELGRLPGVEAATTLGAALDLAEAHADHTEAALRSLRCPTLAQARAVGATPEDWDPLIVVSAHPARDVDDRRRVEALAGRPNAAVGLVTVPSLDARLRGRAFVIGDHGWLQIDGVEEPVRPRHLSSDHVGLLVELLDGAQSRGDEPREHAVPDFAPRRPPSPPDVHQRPPPPPPAPSPPLAGDVAQRDETDGAPAAPATPRRTRLAELMDGVEVVVRVLGEVEAVRCTVDGQPEVKLVPTRQRALEAISYLALRESAVDREDLEISLFPDGANSAKTVYNTVSSARTLLGDDLFPPPEGGRYVLSPAVVTDYGIFCELASDADETEDAGAAADLLHQALTLVRGEPFTGVGRGYSWVGPHRGMIVAQVVDAAEELAEVRLATGDWRAAEWAARQGLRAFPSDERMYRLLMRTARAAGNIPGVQRVFRELCDVLADPDVGVEPEDTVHPETVELLEELTGSVARRRGMGA